MTKAEITNEIERRTVTLKELRAEPEGEGRKIEGYAAVFNSLSDDLGGFIERIQPGAFSKTIQEADVRALWNHDANYVLGRSKSDTLKLSEDEVGLRIEIDPPKAQWAEDALTSMRRGDVDQMSFGFRTIKDDWDQLEDQVIRTLVEVELYDVSPVTFPAYPQTTAQVRSKAESMQEIPEEILPADDNAEPDQEIHSADESAADLAKVRQAHRRRRLEIEKLKSF